MTMTDDSLLQEFITESKDHLDSIEPDLLVMEKEGPAAQKTPEGQELINRVFRAIHSIKGAAGFFGLDALKGLSHVMESVLMLMRDGKLSPTPGVMDPLLNGVDLLNQMLENIACSETVDCKAVIEKLEDILAGKTPGESEETATKPNAKTSSKKPKVDLLPENFIPTFLPNANLLETAIQNGQKRWMVTVNTAADLTPTGRTPEKFLAQLAETGLVLDTCPERGNLTPDTPRFYVLIANVLPPELLTLDIKIPVAQIQPEGAEPAPATAADLELGLEPGPATESASSVQFNPSAEMVEKARTNGQKLWQVQVNPAQDLAPLKRTAEKFMTQLAETGLVLDSVPKKADFKPNMARLDVLIANVLPPDLLTLDIKIPAQQITPYFLSTTVSMAKPENLAEVKTGATPPAPSVTAMAPPEEAPKKKIAGPKAGAAEANESIRVRVDLLNKLMDLAGEMVLARNQLLRAFGGEANTTLNAKSNSILQNVDLITSELQENIMQTRMQPIGSTFSKFPRIVRDLSKQVGKKIELQLSGEEVELDKSIVESLSDPLTHLIRNSCDHGLETPEERLAAGKPETGTILLQAYHESGQINIAISDDGRGIPADKIARKAVEKGLISEEDFKRMTPQEKVQLVLLPGFSTAETVSDLSGRGVGMDVVKTNIEKLGGTITINTCTDPGDNQGTTMLLRLPLTLAIVPSLVIGVANERFAMPQVNLVELVRVPASEISSRIEQVGSAAVLRLRGKLLPLLKLADVLGLERPVEDRRAAIADQRTVNSPLPTVKATEMGEGGATAPGEGKFNRRKDPDSDYNILVVRSSGNNTFGLIADELFDTEEIVVKALSNYLKSCHCFSGATIMGDGRVAMILDVDGILKQCNLSFAEVKAVEDARAQQEAANTATGGSQQSILLFNNAMDEIFALPLSSIQRLEKISLSDLERVGGKTFLTYRGKGLPVVSLDHYLPVRPIDHDLEEAYLIIPKTAHQQGDTALAGILVSRILDTIRTEIKLETSLVQGKGISGSAIINQHLTMFLNPLAILEMAGIDAGKDSLNTRPASLV